MKDGLTHPIEALPDGRIICGHKRTRAAELLGWEEINVWVRDDLALKGSVAVEEQLIWDNLGRQHQTPIDLARCYHRLKEIHKKDVAECLWAGEHHEMRDQIGKKLGMSGRNLDRLLRIVEHTPQEVQDAVSVNKLPMTLAYEVTKLDQPTKAKIGQAIANSGAPVKVMRDAIGPRDMRAAGIGAGTSHTGVTFDGRATSDSRSASDEFVKPAVDVRCCLSACGVAGALQPFPLLTTGSSPLGSGSIYGRTRSGTGTQTFPFRQIARA